ncbi:uncharacterized protein LOC129726847 [Wyeomyia smithii]|uniref:uncharacterized protein LOC129726847 n=1 Tax=Wyeomyia smithii TaxID=174621 RepID=UPI002467E085|nr:uncharacterized protein LOC129726847 [Wyeomyia smithii]
MSQPNHFQPWKQGRPLGMPMPNPATISSHGKLPAAAHQNLHSIQLPQSSSGLHGHQTLPRGPPVGLAPPLAVQTAAASSSTSTISSSTGSFGPGGGISGMSDFLSQLGADKLMLSKLSASYGLTNLAIGDQLVSGQQQLQQQQQQHSPLDDCANDKERELRIQQIFENAIGDNSKKQIVDLLEKISNLRPPERLLLYLRMPGGYPETDPLRQSQNPLGTRSEINHTINWVRSHLEPDPNVSIPKQEVYEDYTAYCERIDIKPLSTADFGKVMKQVFPGIRPRRLGTRGHSRYCYAAMRKATKLAAPKLPDLIASTGEKLTPEDHVPSDEEAWKVIKVWAEAMLPNSFGSINELASFITKNNLNSPASIASRQLLQKKLLQREIKERKKLTAAALKKRRRKRRKTLSTSIDSEVGPSEPQPSSSTTSTQLQSSRHHTLLQHATSRSPACAIPAGSPAMPSAVLLHQVIKHERQDFTDDDNNNTSLGAEAMKQQQQQPPSHQQCHLSTKLNCDTGNGVLASTAAVMPASIAGNAMPATGREMRSPAEEYNIFCKKVRQAQQLKAAAQNQALQIIPSSSLRPPSAAAKRAASIAHLTRQKRFRMLQQQQQQAIEAQNNSAPHYDEMGNLILIESQDLVTSSREDFIIPRERVISICNMDKNALDDYLNCEEENSQDQDQELLQYFPEENHPDGQPAGSTPSSSSGQHAVSSVGQVGGGYGGIFDDSDTNLKISQLRSMLEQNMAQSGGIDKPQVGGQLDGFDGSIGGQQLGLQPGSAAASLAMLSQRHHGNGIASTDGTSCINMDGKKGSNSGSKLTLENCLNNLGNGLAVGTAANGGVTLQSPNGRRKNYNFVPISAGPQSPRVQAQTRQPARSGTPNASPFVSPRNTPIHRKTKAANNGLTLNILQQNQQSLQLSGYQQRPSYVKNELSASAPPSPSLAQNYRFGLNPNPLNSNTMPSFQPICGPSAHMQPQPNMVNSLESRSSSVPLIPNYDGYNHSNFTSVSQTPVPSECDDFSDPNNILDMLNEPSSAPNNLPHSIKLEASDPIMSDILDSEDMFPKAPYNSISRSVPSTPLPHQMSYNQANPNCASLLGSNGLSSKSLFELPKSVPTTPIALNNGRDQLFQYSPETPRDCLINGNSIERGSGKITSFYQRNPTNNNNISVTDGTTVNITAKTAENAAAPPPSTGSGTEMSVLGEGIESLTDAFIGSDTLRYL